MPRILFFVFLAFLCWLLIRVIGGSRKRDAPDVAKRPAPDAAARRVEGMVQCAWCGAYAPSSTATMLADGRSYCGAEHREAAENAQRAAGKRSGTRG